MKLFNITALALFFVVVLATSEDELIDGTRTCAAKLYRELIKDRVGQNVVFSSITIQTLMSLLVSASRNENDEVVTQIKTALSLPNGDENRRNAFKSVLENLKSDNDFKVFDAVKMYFKPNYSVEKWYETIALNNYKAEIETVDFGRSLATSQKINQWVASKTDNKIENFIDKSALSANTQNLLINTLFLRGKWVKPFLKEKNIIKNFHSPNGAKPVTMMTNDKSYNYFEDGEAKYLKMQLLREGGGADMVFVLPIRQDLSKLENNVQKLFQPVAFTVSMVKVTLPKFSFSNDLELKRVLQNIGVKKLFQWGAELKGLTYPDNPYIKISDVLQKAVIQIDEWGVTAAAAAAIDITIDATENTNVFTADHPFLFYIIVDEAIVFAGRVMDP